MTATAPATRSGRLSRLGFAVLLLGIIVLLVVQAVIWRLLEDAPVFGADWTPSRAEAYSYLTGSADPLIIKYGHALRSPRFRYGIFGSSRGMGLSHQHLGVPEAEFFNFSTGSTGFRQSVALIQALAKAGKLPDTLLLTLDNHDIGYFRQIEWPTVFGDPGYHLDYLREELRAGAGPPVMARAAAEAIAAGVRDLVTKFNFERLHGLWQFAHGVPTQYPDLFRPDGSHNMETLGRTHPSLIIYSAPWQSMVAGMKADIARLGRLAAAGHRIIAYETPVAPHLLAELNERRHESTVRLREEIAQACRQHGIVYVPPPAPVPGDENMMWTSGSHAPPAILARHVAGLL